MDGCVESDLLSFSAITDCKNLNGYVLIDSENMETWEKVFCIAFQDVCAVSLFGFLCSQPWIQVFELYFVLFGIFCICIAFEDPSVLSLFGFLCSQPWIITLIICFLFYFDFLYFVLHFGTSALLLFCSQPWIRCLISSRQCTTLTTHPNDQTNNIIAIHPSNQKWETLLGL